MDLTRRELCSALSGALLPVLLSPKDSDQPAAALPSTMYPYDKLPVQTSNGAEFRTVLKGKLATGESPGGTRNDVAAGRRTTSSTPPSTF